MIYLWTLAALASLIPFILLSRKPKPFTVEYVSPKLDPPELRNL